MAGADPAEPRASAPPGSSINFTHPRRHRTGAGSHASQVAAAVGVPIDYTHARRRDVTGPSRAEPDHAQAPIHAVASTSHPIDYTHPARRRGKPASDDANALVSIDFVTDDLPSPAESSAASWTGVRAGSVVTPFQDGPAELGRSATSRHGDLVGWLAGSGDRDGVPQAVVPIERLGLMAKLAEGSQGVVWRTDRLRLNRTEPSVVKRYKPAVLDELDDSALRGLVEFLFALPRAEGQSLLATAAWPVRTVVDGARTVGFVMPEVPQRYWLNLSLPSGRTRRVLGQVQHLLNDDGFSERRGLMVSDRTRLQLLLSLAYRLDFLHKRGVAVGDLSPKNLLFATSPRPRCYFVDCDAMALAGRSALPQLETPGWQVRAISGETLATPSADYYKLALLVLRMLARDQSTYRSDALPSWLAVPLGAMVRAGLGPDPRGRPSAASWVAPLREAARRAGSRR